VVVRINTTRNRTKISRPHQKLETMFDTKIDDSWP